MADPIGMTVQEVLQAAVASLKKETDSRSLGAAEALANLNQELNGRNYLMRFDLSKLMGLDTSAYVVYEEEAVGGPFWTG